MDLPWVSQRPLRSVVQQQAVVFVAVVVERETRCRRRQRVRPFEPLHWRVRAKADATRQVQRREPNRLDVLPAKSPRRNRTRVVRDRDPQQTFSFQAPGAENATREGSPGRGPNPLSTKHNIYDSSLGICVGIGIGIRKDTYGTL